jgi:F-type H+-transporting ATPase subunit delta
MNFSAEQYAQVLFQALKESPKKEEIIINNFLSELKSNNDLFRFEKIMPELKNLFLKDRGVMPTKIITARTGKINEEILNRLSKALDLKIEYEVEVDEDLVGGMVVKIEDILVDASVKRQLQGLHLKLQS